MKSVYFDKAFCSREISRELFKRGFEGKSEGCYDSEGKFYNFLTSTPLVRDTEPAVSCNQAINYLLDKNSNLTLSTDSVDLEKARYKIIYYVSGIKKEKPYQVCVYISYRKTVATILTIMTRRGFNLTHWNLQILATLLDAYINSEQKLYLTAKRTKMCGKMIMKRFNDNNIKF